MLGRLGGLSVRLATYSEDVSAAQRLRYRVFYEEMSATPSRASRRARSDQDDFDPICDHLVVLDEATRSRQAAIAGTCRLLRQDVAERHGGFCSDGEFEICRLIEAHSPSRFLEVGRSCVLKPYRVGPTIELLWHGIWIYAQHHRIDAMLGCASFQGTDPIALAVPLSFLHHFARAPSGWRVRAVPGRGVEMNMMPREAIDARAAVRSLPPMIKGYLRLGASVGEHAVVDQQFGTTDVMVVLRTAAVAHRYVSRHSALDNRMDAFAKDPIIAGECLR